MSIGTSEISGPQNASGERGNEIVLRGAGAILYKCRDEEVLLEGRAGTGKTVSACKKMVDCAFSFPGANILCARQTRESMTDSILITLESVIGEHHPEVTRMSRSNRHAYQLNGSQIVCAGLDEPAKAFGTGWDLIYVNEAIETSLNSWELFARAGRNPRIARKAATPRMPYRQRIADLNPGAPTHWANKRATRAGNELRAVVTFDDWLRLDEYNSGPQDGMMRRLISVHQDNPAFFNIDPAIWQWTEEGVDYRERKLSKMTGHRKMRMLHGIWCAAEGSVYPAFSEQDNTCPWFAVPADWPLYWGTDPGFDHPCAMLWFAVAPNGKLFIVHEVIESGKGVDEHARTVRAIERRFGWDKREIHRYGDPQHAFSSTAQSKKTIAEQWKDERFTLHPWPRTGDNMDGMVDAVRQRINDRSLVVLDTCTETIAALQSWSFARNADGTPKNSAQGKDKYEEEFKDPNDVIRGIVAIDPTHAPRTATVVAQR